jgi:hypothetical protein
MLLGRASYEAFRKVWPDLMELADVVVETT